MNVHVNIDEPSRGSCWDVGTTARDIRKTVLSRAQYYRNQYRQDRAGVQRRMFAAMLDLARQYRAKERT